jgi:transcriptional regulator with XRE-family HTH domain
VLASVLANARNFDAERPRLVGVYFLMRGADVFYIGQSINIDARIAAHRTDPRMREISGVFWIDVQESELDAYEGALLRALRPIGNTRRTPGNKADDARILSKLGIESSAVPARVPVPRTRDHVALGAHIKALRKRAGLTQYDVALRLGVHDTAVSHWEKGWARPDRDRTIALADVLGVDVETMESMVAVPSEPTPFGLAIARLRADHDMSLREFADRVGTTASVVLAWERGSHGTPLARMQEIAREFSVDVSMLIGAAS